MSILRRNMKIRLSPEKQAPRELAPQVTNRLTQNKMACQAFFSPLTKLAPQAVNRRRKLPVSKWENSLPRIEYNTQAEIVANYARQLP